MLLDSLKCHAPHGHPVGARASRGPDDSIHRSNVGSLEQDLQRQNQQSLPNIFGPADRPRVNREGRGKWFKVRARKFTGAAVCAGGGLVSGRGEWRGTAKSRSFRRRTRPPAQEGAEMVWRSAGTGLSARQGRVGGEDVEEEEMKDREEVKGKR